MPFSRGQRPKLDLPSATSERISYLPRTHKCMWFSLSCKSIISKAWGHFPPASSKIQLPCNPFHSSSQGPKRQEMQVRLCLSTSLGHWTTAELKTLIWSIYNKLTYIQVNSDIPSFPTMLEIFLEFSFRITFKNKWNQWMRCYPNSDNPYLLWVKLVYEAYLLWLKTVYEARSRNDGEMTYTVAHDLHTVPDRLFHQGYSSAETQVQPLGCW